MLSVVERARWKCEDVCFLLFPFWMVGEVIFCERGVNHCGRRPTGRAKSCERGDKGWLDGGFLWLGQKEWDRTGNGFKAGAGRRVGGGMDHRLKRGRGRARVPISPKGLGQPRTCTRKLG